MASMTLALARISSQPVDRTSTWRYGWAEGSYLHLPRSPDDNFCTKGES